MSAVQQAIMDGMKHVLGKWCKQRKAEERGSRSRASREEAFSSRVNFTDVAHKVLPKGYEWVSGNGRYTVPLRQFFYNVRDEFDTLCERQLTYKTFSNKIVVQFINRNPELTAHWKITKMARGNLIVPNTGSRLIVPCSTLDIDRHLADMAAEHGPFDDLDELDFVKIQWPSLAAGVRIQGVVYIEKEGFDEQLVEARVAEMHDVAILSCKGQSVVAARKFADHTCRVNGGVPLFIFHDLDKDGFLISERLTSNSIEMEEADLVKYEFENEIIRHDCGLRLKDALEYGLKSERCNFRGCFANDTICTKEEQDFLRSGKRIELNGFSAPQFVEWVPKMLRRHGLKQRLVPDDPQELEDAYRRALAVAEVNHRLPEIVAQAIENAKATKLPKSLLRDLRKRTTWKTPAWDEVMYRMVQETMVFDDE